MKGSSLRVLLVVISAALSSPVLFAQQSSSQTGTPVNMIVTVEARRGGQPGPVQREDVMVYEGKTRDKVTSWIPATGDHAQLEIMVLIDDDAGVSLGSQLEDIRKFINGQPASTRVGVAYMENGTAQIAQNLTEDHAQAAKAIRLPLGLPGANASPYFSLSDLIKRWPPGSAARREVVMVSDGVDRYGDFAGTQDPYVDAAVADALRAGVLVYAIYTPGAGHFGHSYWRSYWGQLYLSQVADQTGGESYYIGFTGPPVSLSPFLDDVSHRLTNQYLLTFLAQPVKKSELRPVKLRTELPNTELVGAEKLFVPASPE